MRPDPAVDANKSHDLLGWRPVWTMWESVQMTVWWYRDYYCASLSGLSRFQA